MESENTQVLVSEPTRTVCLNCGTEYEGDYCPKCGQSRKVGKLSIKRVMTEILPDIYNLDNKFIHTLVALFTRPGYMIRDYMEGRRAAYYKPISFLFLISAFYIIIANYMFDEASELAKIDLGELKTDIDGQTVQIFNKDSMFYKICTSVITFFQDKAWSTLLLVVLFVVPNKLAFRHCEYGKTLNVAEHFFIMAFVESQIMIVNVVLSLVYWLFGSRSMENSFLIIVLCSAIDFKQLMGIKWGKSVRLTCYSWFLFITLCGVCITLLCLLLYACGVFDVIIDKLNISVQ